MVDTLDFTDDSMQIGMHFGVLSIFIGTLAANGDQDALRAMAALKAIAAKFNTQLAAQEVVTASVPDKKRGWSPEQRAAAAERMRNRRSSAPPNITLCPPGEAGGLS